MRRVLASFAALVGLAAPAVAYAAPTARLTARFSPNRLGTPTTIKFGIAVSDSIPRSVPPALTEVDLALPAGMGLATSTLGLAECDPSRLRALGPNGCPSNSHVGGGAALGLIQTEGETVDEAARVEAFLGPPVEEEEQVLFFAEAVEPVLAELVFAGRLLSARSPRFGGELDTPIPAVAAWPAGPLVSVTRFSSSLGPEGLTYYRHVHGAIVPFHPRGIAVPTHCPRGGFPFEATLAFTDGSRVVADAHVRCPPR
jgi:hypothetical protein